MGLYRTARCLARSGLIALLSVPMPGPGADALAKPVPSSSPTAMAADPPTAAKVSCRDILVSLPTGGENPAPYFAAAACLRRQDSLEASRADAAAPSRHTPLERNLRSPKGFSTRPSDSLLRAKLPAAKIWFMTHMERQRVKRDIPRMLDMAYLTEVKGLPDAELHRELAALYQAVPDGFRAGLALLRQSELDSLQNGYIQYQMESLLHNASSDVPSLELLDSLTARYPHRTWRTAEILEGLAWNNRDYPAAYKNLLAMMSLKNPGPGVVLERVNRLQSLGYFDYAAALLDKLAWRKLPPPWLTVARALHLRIRSQLQDWTSVIAIAGETAAGAAGPQSGIAAPASGAASPEVTGGVRQPPFGDEESHLIGTAYLKLGMAPEALARGKRLEEKGEPPWGFRGRLLKAQAQMAMGKPKEAAQTLTALKKDPKRQEGTGPILFWQGCLALDQGRFASADSLLVLASAYAGSEESQRALEYRFFLLLDTAAGSRPHFFRGMPESPHSPADRRLSLDKVSQESPLWPFAQLEKAQIHLQNGDPDSAEAVFDSVSKRSPDRLAGFQAEAKAAFTAEKLPGGRQAALARYEDLLIKYQQGVIPEFSRGRIKALK